jgi:hypothetical protein
MDQIGIRYAITRTDLILNMYIQGPISHDKLSEIEKLT